MNKFKTGNRLCARPRREPMPPVPPERREKGRPTTGSRIHRLLRKFFTPAQPTLSYPVLFDLAIQKNKALFRTLSSI